MQKRDLSLLMSGAADAAKAQLVLHAVCNLLNLPFTPEFVGVSYINVSTKACKVYASLGIAKRPIADMGTCFSQVCELANLLMAQGRFTRDALQSETDRLQLDIYPQDYQKGMCPF